MNNFTLKSFLVISFLIQFCYLNRFYDIKSYQKITVKFYNFFYWEPLNYFYNEFLQKIPGLANILYFIGNLFVIFCIKLGNKATIFLCVFFYVLPNILVIFCLAYNLFFTTSFNKIIYILIVLNFIVLRLTSCVIFLLNDFSKKNLEFLEKFLVITKLNKAFKYDFNYKNMRNPTQKKLNLYSSRFEFFKQIEIFTSAFTFYKNNIINKTLKPYITAFFFLCTLKICFIHFLIQIDSLIFFIFLFIIITFKEYNNIKKEKEQQ